MVPSLCQCPGVAGKVCNCFLLVTGNNSHRLCTACRGKTYDIEDCCEDCHGWPDEKSCRVGEYLAKLSAQHEKKRGKKAKVSSSSFSGFSPSMHVPLCNLPSPVCTGVVTAALSSTMFSVTYLAATPVASSAPFAPPLNVMPAEPLCMLCHKDSSEDCLKMLAAVEEV